MDTIQGQNPAIIEALNQIKTWKNEGKIEDAKNGCKELLEADSENVEAKALLAELENPSAAPTSEKILPEQLSGPAQTDEAAPKQAESPLYTLGTESGGESLLDTSPAPAKPDKKKLFIKIGISITTVLILGGGVYFGYSKFLAKVDSAIEGVPEAKIQTEIETPAIEEDVEEEIAAEVTEPEEEEPTAETTLNDQRFLDLTVIEQTLEEYYEENHVYPPAEELLSIFTDLPTDQMDGQINDFGEEYGYTYAVYDNYLGSNQEYILSGLFETDDKETSIWTTGEATLDHPDYRDTGLNNIIFIRYSGAATEENAPKVKVKR